ncbi:hypothetical protein FQN60_011252 [Etheostoma spectabile]|uniref:PX domain-containing protein n=1 Tax=Etheostoma spectabile TaxID=54343 RepID=A0A5J5DRQ1_9PERO|nr:hypothetical protein FQN60_011252 [Etheostoma spectabile]
MEASSDRIPPPFPATEEPGARPFDMADGDSDEGEDIFSNPMAVSRGVSQPSAVNEEPPDLFSEEEEASSTTVKSNGVHSDDDNDLFEDEEAHVELSTDTPGSSARKELSTSSGPLLCTCLYFQTSLAMFRSKTFSVRRRYSDFLGLYEKLSVKQSLHGCIIPPPPEKSVVGMTKVKVGMDDPSSVEFVERRRAALERQGSRVVSHPSLLQDPDVREFLEKEEVGIL